MITRAIVENVIDDYCVQVRIPIFNRAANTKFSTVESDLVEARICVAPKFRPNLKKGDVVFVSFEENQFDKVVILGYLFNQNITTVGDIELNYLKVNLEAKLPLGTKIGEVSLEQVQHLSGIEGNVQKQLNLLKETTRALKTSVEDTVVICDGGGVNGY